MEKHNYTPREVAAQLAQMPKEKDRFSTSYSELDAQTGGLIRGGVTLVAARPAVGKTALGINMISRILRQRSGNILLFSPGERQEAVTAQVLNAGLGLRLERLLNGDLSPATSAELCGSFLKARKGKLKIVSSLAPTLKDIRCSCKNTPDLQLVVVDHMECICKPYDQWDIDKDWRGNRVNMDDILRLLKLVAQENNVPVVCMANLHRSLEKRKDRRPKLKDLEKIEVSAEQADQIIFLYRESYYEPYGENVTECNVAKNGRGEVGTVRLRWNPEAAIYLGEDDDMASLYL